MDYKLEELIDISLVQNLLTKLNNMYSCTTAIIDNDGKILTAVGWQDICTRFHRANPQCEKECIKSDQYILEHISEANPSIRYKCLNGLIDIATPLIIDGNHLGVFFTGQVFLEEPDLEFFKKQAVKYGFDEDEYLGTIKKVPIWSEQKLSSFLDFEKELIEVVVGLGLKNLKEIEANKSLKEAEKKQRENEKRLAFYSDNSPMAVIEWNSDFTVTLWTGASERVFGWKATEVVGKKVTDFDLIYSDDLILVGNTFEQLRNSKDEFVISTNRNYRKDGSVITCEWYNTIFRNQSGEMVFVLSHALDITERRIAGEALKQSEEKYRLLLSNMHDVIYSVSLETMEFMYLSPSFERITGYSIADIEEMGGREKFISAVVDKKEFAEWDLYITQINEENTLHDFNYETLWLCKDGTYKYLNDHWIPIFVNGKLNSTYGILTDVTLRKQSEKELQKKMTELTVVNEELKQYTYANQELKQFAYIASHQLQEPIRTVTNYTKIIEEDYSDLIDEKGRRHLQVICDATSRMALLINSLMEFSRLGRNKKLVYVDCRTLVETVIVDLETLIVSSGALIELEDMPKMYLYEVEIRQLFQNLITNSVKFQKKGNQPKITIRSERINGKIRFSVSDNGIGIASVHFDRIFDIFQRLHNDEKDYEGKGIGLAYCKKVVQMHQGEMWVESSVGEGTTFLFTIPDLNP